MRGSTQKKERRESHSSAALSEQPLFRPRPIVSSGFTTVNEVLVNPSMIGRVHETEFMDKRNEERGK